MAENLQKTITNTSNRLWRNVGAYPLVAFSFMLRVEGMWDLPCKQIHNLSRENEFDYIQEGGLNDYVHAKRKPISKPFTFQVERYVGVDLAVASDPLALGTELVLPLLLFVNKYAVWDVGDMKPVRTYAFTGCTVIGKNYGTLDAEKSELLVETTTISYREMACVDIYSELDGMGLDTWGFDGHKKKGTGPRRYNQATSNTEEATKAQMQENAQLWSIGGKDKPSDAPMNSNERKIPQNKVSKETLAKKARLYPKTSSVKKPENKVPEARQWSIGGKDGPADAPKNSNERKIAQNDVSKETLAKKAKLYPKTSSVKKPENKIPEAQTWSIGGKDGPPDAPKNSNQRGIPENDADRPAFEEKAQTWSIGGKDGPADAPKNSNQKEIPQNDMGKETLAKNAKLYPGVSSVKKPENKVPEPRLWPKKKSAQTITQYLNDYR